MLVRIVTYSIGKRLILWRPLGLFVGEVISKATWQSMKSLLKRCVAGVTCQTANDRIANSKVNTMREIVHANCCPEMGSKASDGSGTDYRRAVSSDIIV